MGYFDDAKASREEENSLEHSSGAWKKHKYIQKIGTGAKAKYKYAKDKAKETWDTKVTGEKYKQQYDEASDRLDKLTSKVWTKDSTDEEQRQYVSDKFIARKQMAEASSNYDKSLKATLERASKTVDKGKALIKDFFTPKTKVTASSNLTGKETINTKPAEKVTLKKNKLSFKK